MALIFTFNNDFIRTFKFFHFLPYSRILLVSFPPPPPPPHKYDHWMKHCQFLERVEVIRCLNKPEKDGTQKHWQRSECLCKIKWR